MPRKKLGYVQQKVFAVLDSMGWQIGLQTLCKFANLEWPRQKQVVFLARKKWIEIHGKQEEQEAIALEQGSRYAVFGQYNKPGGNVRGKRWKQKQNQNIIYTILEEKGVLTSIQTIIDIAKSRGLLISYSRVVEMRVQYRKINKIERKDGRTHRDIPERNMDTQVSPEAMTFLQSLPITVEQISKLGEYFQSVRLIAASQQINKQAA